MEKPTAAEYNPYFQKYIDLVPTGNILDLFDTNTRETETFFTGLPAEKHSYRYAENKWTPRDVLLHVIDTERVMSYRALVASRGDTSTPLPPVDEDLFARNAQAEDREMAELVQEFLLVRAATRKLYEHITEEQSLLLGNGVAHAISARALGYIIIGHTMHHVAVVKARYL